MDRDWFLFYGGAILGLWLGFGLGVWREEAKGYCRASCAGSEFMLRGAKECWCADGRRINLPGD
jgi:hypothetical protein